MSGCISRRNNVWLWIRCTALNSLQSFRWKTVQDFKNKPVSGGRLCFLPGQTRNFTCTCLYTVPLLLLGKQPNENVFLASMIRKKKKAFYLSKSHQMPVGNNGYQSTKITCSKKIIN